MVYSINGIKFSDVPSDMLCTEGELETLYREQLDDVYGTISICGLDYDASYTLEMIDPIAFGGGFSDFLDDGKWHEVFSEDDKKRTFEGYISDSDFDTLCELLEEDDGEDE